MWLILLLAILVSPQTEHLKRGGQGGGNPPHYVRH